MTIHSFGRPGLRLPALVCAALLMSLAATGPARAATCRVSAAGTTAGSGTWASPMNLQTALTTGTCKEVWVAAGIYEPGSARTDSFNILPGVAVYGGFAGSETSRSARNPVANVTTLSGDIGSVGDPSDNSYHVVFMDGSTSAGIITASTVLDGFTISGGQADGGGSSQDRGAGLYCGGRGSGNECSPMLGNLTFSRNNAEIGGAMCNDGFDGISSPTLTDVTFSENSAEAGGAMFNAAFANGSSSPTLINVTFSGNSVDQEGGAMLNMAYAANAVSSPTLINVTFSGNSAIHGGAMYNSAVESSISSPILSNVTFSGNHADLGGAMYNHGTLDGVSSPTLSNVVLWGDTAAISGAEIYNEVSSTGTASTTIDHSVVQDGCPGGSTCTALVITDPVLGALGNHGGSTDTMLLGTGSSAIDTGTCSGAPVTDQRGVSRPQGPACDIGAVEMGLAPPVPTGSIPVPMLDWRTLLALAVLLGLIAGFGRWHLQAPRKRT